jgi:hypothetical protein
LFKHTTVPLKVTIKTTVFWAAVSNFVEAPEGTKLGVLDLKLRDFWEDPIDRLPVEEWEGVDMYDSLLVPLLFEKVFAEDLVKELLLEEDLLTVLLRDFDTSGVTLGGERLSGRTNSLESTLEFLLEEEALTILFLDFLVFGIALGGGRSPGGTTSLNLSLELLREGVALTDPLPGRYLNCCSDRACNVI